MTPDISVILPVFNRGDVMRYTLESVRRASAGLHVETIVVDDGSTPPTADALARLGFAPNLLVRQENQGLLFARLAGFARATGRNVVFLDSDDLVAPEKFQSQLAAMDRAAAEVSYSDSAHCTIEGDYDALRPTADAPYADMVDVAEFFITVQPAPHSPIFRTEWLRRVVADAFFPPAPLYNPVAEIWFYHNAAPRAGRVVRVPGPLTIIGVHATARLTDHWERLGIASLAVMEAFVRTSPVDTPAARRARRLAGEKAFLAWRRLPRGISPAFETRLLAVWRTLAPGNAPALGGAYFQVLAQVLGPARAGHLLKRLQNSTYKRCRTLTDAEFDRLFYALPAPNSPP